MRVRVRVRMRVSRVTESANALPRYLPSAIPPSLTANTLFLILNYFNKENYFLVEKLIIMIMKNLFVMNLKSILIKQIN